VQQKTYGGYNPESGVGDISKEKLKIEVINRMVMLRVAVQ
jgi:hypothetical protein